MSRIAPDSDEIFLTLSASLDKSERDRIFAEAARRRMPAHRILFGGGWLTPYAYTIALAQHHAVDSVAHPDSAQPGDVLIDAAAETPTGITRAISAARRSGRRPVLLTRTIDRAVGSKKDLTYRKMTRTIDALRISNPTNSAGCRIWLWQYISGTFMIGAMLGVLVVAPDVASTGLLLVAAIVFAGVSAFRVIVLIAALLPPSESRVAVTADMSNDELPTYSVLVPLYREAAIVPSLIDALAALDYPRGKLDVALILEESDIDTRLAVARANMPAYMRVIIVPDRQPRTKPKALNVALTLSNSMLVAVFDAEDIPAPDQLRKAAAAFAAVPGCYSCLQARLTIYNSRQSWVTRQFALEYATLFQAFLPALVRLGFPLPLSGTSNHFPRTALHQAVAWDPYNVTEDADLGIRMARAGCRIGLLDCATREEAPPTFRHWLPQRTRWIKGWMQTYLVHTREPWRLLRQMGLWRTVGFHAIFAGYLLSLLAFPIMLVVAGIELTQPAPFARTPGSIQHTALMIAVTDLLIGTVAALLTGLISARRAGLGDLAGHLLAAPIYWLCISAAGYRALAQMFWNQHLWEKTEHAPRRRLRARNKALKHLRPRGARR